MVFFSYFSTSFKSSPHCVLTSALSTGSLGYTIPISHWIPTSCVSLNNCTPKSGRSFKQLFLLFEVNRSIFSIGAVELWKLDWNKLSYVECDVCVFTGLHLIVGFWILGWNKMILKRFNWFFFMLKNNNQPNFLMVQHWV